MISNIVQETLGNMLNVELNVLCQNSMCCVFKDNLKCLVKVKQNRNRTSYATLEC